MPTSSNHLSAARVEDLDGFTLGAIGCGLGVDLELEAADLSGLLRGELELELQPVGVTATANDEGARKRVQAEVADAIDSGCAIMSMEMIRPSSGPVRRPTAFTPG